MFFYFLFFFFGFLLFYPRRAAEIEIFRTVLFRYYCVVTVALDITC